MMMIMMIMMMIMDDDERYIDDVDDDDLHMWVDLLQLIHSFHQLCKGACVRVVIHPLLGGPL